MKRFNGTAALVLLAFATQIHAQAAAPGQTPLPSIADPTAAERQLRTLPDRAASGPTIVASPDATSDAAPPPGSDARFTLKKIVLEGATRYPADELLAPYQSLSGQSIPVAKLFEIASALTARFRADGWTYSRVLVPAQQIEDGVAHLKVVEGYAAEVEFAGASGRRSAFEQRITRRLAAERPLRQASLERYLLLMNDVPGAVATASLTPSQQFGGMRVITTVAQERFAAEFGAGNRGSRVLGPLQFDATLTMNGVLGGYDSTRLNYVTTGTNQELTYVGLAQTWLLGSEGTRLELTASGSKSKPELQAEFAGLNLETRSRSAGVTITHPFLRSRASNLSVRLGASYHEGETRNEDADPLRDEVPSARIGFTYDVLDAWRGLNVFDVQVSKGFNAFGATRAGAVDSSRPDASASYVKSELYLARLQSIGVRWSVLLAFQGQLAFNDLLSSEEFAFGGPLFGRAYDASELVGDSGIAGKFELRYSLRGHDATFPPLNLYGFFDAGRLYRRNPRPDEKPREFATAAGAGARFNIGAHVHGYVEGAVPLNRIVAAEGDDDPRVFGGITVTF